MIVALLPDLAHSAPALDWALAQAGRTDVGLDVVVAGSDVPGGPQYVSPQALAGAERHLRASGRLHRLRRGGDDPAALVLREAETSPPDLIVLSTRRRSATLKLVTGSIAQRVLLEAEVPVVAIKRANDPDPRFTGSADTSDDLGTPTTPAP